MTKYRKITKESAKIDEQAARHEFGNTQTLVGPDAVAEATGRWITPTKKPKTDDNDKINSEGRGHTRTHTHTPHTPHTHTHDDAV